VTITRSWLVRWVLGALLGGAAVAAGAQPTVVSSSPPAEGGEGSLPIGGADSRQVAQVFMASKSRLIGQVRLPVWCSPDAILGVEIQSASFRGPSGVVLSNWSVPGATLPPLTGTELRILRLPQPVSVGETSRYAIVLRSVGSCSVLRGPPRQDFDFEEQVYVVAPPNPADWTCLTCNAPAEEQFQLPFIVVGEDRALLPGFAFVTEAAPATWHAALSEGQVIGSPAAFGGRARFRYAATLWFNEFGDVATLRFGERGGQANVALRCAAAGSDGPAVWTATTNIHGATVELLAGDLQSTPPSSECPVSITNIASLRAAAAARHLYLEIQQAGVPALRGQLFERPIGAPGIRVTAGASAQQMVPGERAAPRWTRAAVSLLFAEQASLDAVGYDYDERHRYRTVALYCGRPGEVGDLVAYLPAPKSLFSKEDFYPVPATGPCGMAIETTGALLEALLRGNLYVEMELLDPAGTWLRGQFPAP
jgi:hypothetical protein